MSVSVLGVDTNVLVRFFVRDDLEQYRLAEALIGRVEAGGLFVDPLVLVELNWVLLRAYRHTKDDVFVVLQGMTEFRQFQIGERAKVLEALSLVQATGADFSDAMIGLMHQDAGCVNTVTFDIKAQRLPQMIAVERALA